uniref:Uncharacterized protein n=1 Tax=Romanomermis culicivorax TaxID=13658 RepID=A0A915HFT1_ROMCU
LGWLVSGLIGLLVLVTRTLPVYAWSSTYDRTWDYCIGISSVMSPLGVVVHRFVVCSMYLAGLLIYFHLMYLAHRKKSIMAATSLKKIAVIPAVTVLKVKENTTRMANMSGMYSGTKVESSFIGIKNSPPTGDVVDGVVSDVDVARPLPSKQRTQRRRRTAHTSLINVTKMIIFSYTISTTFICVLALIDYDSPWAESRVIFYLLSFTLVTSKLCDSLILILKSSVLRSAKRHKLEKNCTFYCTAVQLEQKMAEIAAVLMLQIIVLCSDFLRTERFWSTTGAETPGEAKKLFCTWNFRGILNDINKFSEPYTSPLISGISREGYKPVNVYLELHVQTIIGLSTTRGLFEVDVFVSEIWQDKHFNFLSTDQIDGDHIFANVSLLFDEMNGKDFLGGSGDGEFSGNGVENDKATARSAEKNFTSTPYQSSPLFEEEFCRSYLNLGADVEKEIFTPNVNIWNSKMAKIHKSPTVNKFINVYADGTIWRNHRMKVQ